jgi:hypothetical protein
MQFVAFKSKHYFDYFNTNVMLFNCRNSETNPSKSVLRTLVVVPHSKRSQLNCSAECDFYFMAVAGRKWNQPHVFIAHRNIFAVDKSTILMRSLEKKAMI